MSRGGKREGAGRPTKVDEEHANALFLRALKEIYSKTTDDDAKVEFIKSLVKSTRGEIFVAEHVFGKPKEVIDLTNKISSFNLNYLTDEELSVLAKIHGRNDTDTNAESD